MSLMKEVANSETGKVVSFENSSRTYITSADGSTPNFQKFLDDETYARALSGIVIKCVDIMVFDPKTGRVLLGDRDQLPHDGVWPFGGRKRPGESDKETAVRNLERELGIKVSEDDIEPVGTQYELIWDTREHSDTYNEEGELVTGCHDSGTLMMLPIDEASARFTHNREFGSIEWYDFGEILDAPPEKFHPALVQMVEDTFESFTSPDR